MFKRNSKGQFTKGSRSTSEFKKRDSRRSSGRPFKKGYESPHQFKKGEKRLTRIRPERSKEKHWNWKGGASFEPYTIDWTRSLRISIRERDKYTCQICSEKQDNVTHHIHHIDYDKHNCNPDNLITLCATCHGKTNVNRKYWKTFFTQSA